MSPRLLVGTTLGSTAAIVPITLGAIPFFARLTESALDEVEYGRIEAVLSMGGNAWHVIGKALLPEALPALLAATTLTIVMLIGFSSMAGVIGGGGLGDLAIRYGYQRFNDQIMVGTVLILVLMVQGVQMGGDRLVRSLGQFPHRAHLVGAYSLGKAQRIIRLLREAGWDRPIHVHGALERLNALYEREGVPLGPLSPTRDLPKGALGGEVAIAPPSAIQDRWARRFADPVTAFASGWMGVRARARQRGVELPLVVSDHADWTELTETFLELKPDEVWITHGREEGLLRWAEINGQKARALRLVGYDEEDEEALEIRPD